MINREYRVRKGTIWTFQLTRGAEQRPFPGFVAVGADVTTGRGNYLRAQADDTGRVHLALPSESSDVNLNIQESSWALISA